MYVYVCMYIYIYREREREGERELCFYPPLRHPKEGKIATNFQLIATNVLLYPGRIIATNSCVARRSPRRASPSAPSSASPPTRKAVIIHT